MVRKVIFDEPPVCKTEILRYSGAKKGEEDDEVMDILISSFREVRKKLIYNVCYDKFSVDINGSVCDFGAFKIESKALAKNLSGCKSAIVFGATVGTQIDRLIAKYGSLSPSKALMLQAIGAERIEALCDAFCESVAISEDRKLKPRFSPGYGDVSLEVQKDIFRVLDCSKQIGLCLNDSLLMSPSKSVTAIAGVTDEKYEPIKKVNKCRNCAKIDCEFRS